MEEKNEEEEIFQAIIFAREKHKDQKRKVNGRPYIEHPLLVCEILQEEGARKEISIAGLLHDVLEDTPCSKEEISREFGEEVLTLVEACTDKNYGNPATKENWKERKEKAIKKVKNMSTDALLIKVADNIANNNSLKEDIKKFGPEETWQHFNASKEQKRIHQKKLLEVFKKRLGSEQSLVKKAENLYREVFKQ